MNQQNSRFLACDPVLLKDWDLPVPYVASVAVVWDNAAGTFRRLSISLNGGIDLARAIQPGGITTRETVAGLTPASRATSRIVGCRGGKDPP